MKNLNLLFILKNFAILFLLSFTNCDNEKVEIENISETQNDIYVCGHENNYPTFWKNSISNYLENNGKTGDIISIKTNDNNVFCLGFLSENTGIISNYVWKNNDIIIKLDPFFQAIDFAIDVNDIYVIGLVYNPQFGSYQGKLWKNGVLSNLTSTGKESFSSITIKNHDIYIAGYIYIGNNSYAAYWKNGTPTILTNGTTESGINSIEIFENNVYVMGFEKNSNDVSVAKYWKNGIPTLLTNGNYDATAGTIRFIENDVYVNGVEIDSNGNEVLKYWKNGEEKTLTNRNYYYPKISSMEIIDNNVYTIGYSDENATLAAVFNYDGISLLTKFNSSFNDMCINN
jgi:hypothetical protein